MTSTRESALQSLIAHGLVTRETRAEGVLRVAHRTDLTLAREGEWLTLRAAAHNADRRLDDRFFSVLAQPAYAAARPVRFCLPPFPNAPEAEVRADVFLEDPQSVVEQFRRGLRGVEMCSRERAPMTFPAERNPCEESAAASETVAQRIADAGWQLDHRGSILLDTVRTGARARIDWRTRPGHVLARAPLLPALPKDVFCREAVARFLLECAASLRLCRPVVVPEGAHAPEALQVEVDLPEHLAHEALCALSVACDALLPEVGLLAEDSALAKRHLASRRGGLARAATSCPA